jgi:ferredoxin-fold anticodon binding domain-containing protein
MVDRSRKERRCYVYTLRCNVWGEECEADVMEETIIVLMQVGGEEAEQDKTP